MVLLRPTSQNLLFSLTNTSLAFFLFSFHVHEKTILVAAVPLLMLLGHAGLATNSIFFCFLFVKMHINDPSSG